MSDFDPRALRNAFGAFMTGVTVVTAHDAEGKPLGFTANSFTSVSMDPPLVLVCLANSSSNYDALINAKGFAVNILAEDQMEISNTFARPSEDRFAGVAWHSGPYGSPVIDATSAWFDCSMFKTVEAGDHVILIGQVQAFDSVSTPGLGYARGGYVQPSLGAVAASAAPNIVVSALIERNGEVLLIGSEHGGMQLPESAVGANETVSAAVARLVETTGLKAAPGFIYSVFEDEARKMQHISFLCQAAEGAPVKGAFVPLNPQDLDSITDPAILTMVERFAHESKLGDFGIYYGNQNSGEVRKILQ